MSSEDPDDPDERSMTVDESGMPTSARVGYDSGVSQSSAGHYRGQFDWVSSVGSRGSGGYQGGECPPGVDCSGVPSGFGSVATYGNMAATAGEHWHYSEQLGTFRNTFGASAANGHFPIWAGASKYASVLVRARTTANIYGSAGKALTGASLAMSAYEYSQSSRGPWDKFRFTAEVGVTAASSIKPSEGTAIGIGWKIGRYIVADLYK